MSQLGVGGHLERHMVPWTPLHTMNSRSRAVELRFLSKFALLTGQKRKQNVYKMNGIKLIELDRFN